MVVENMIESAERQKRNYGGQHMAIPMVGQKILLDDTARGKLDPHWTGPWEIKEPITLELQMGSAKHIVHINRVQPLLIGDVDRFSSCRGWSPPCLITVRVQCWPQDLQDGGKLTGHHHIVTRSGWVVRASGLLWM